VDEAIDEAKLFFHVNRPMKASGIMSPDTSHQ